MTTIYYDRPLLTANPSNKGNMMNNSIDHSLSRSVEIKLVEKLIARLDLDAMADELATSFQKSLIKQIKGDFFEDIDLAENISMLLHNDRTKAGKAYKKACEGLVLKMVDQIYTEE